MKLHIIPILCLLGLPIVLATKQALSTGRISIVYQEANIYPYQRQMLLCKSTDPLKHVFPTPLDKGEYYVENPLEGDVNNLKTARETKRIEDDFPELKVVFNGKSFFVYYTAPREREGVERLYFECIDAAVPDVTAIIQLNIMPEEKYLPKEEHLVLDELKYPSKAKGITYVKQLTPGVKTITECKNSDLILDNETGVSVKPTGAKKYIHPVTKIEYQDVGENVIKYKATNKKHIIDLRDGRVISTVGVGMHCQGKPENQLLYVSPYMDDIPGLHVFTKKSTDTQRAGESVKLIQIKTEDDTQVLIDVPPDSLVPKDCLNEVSVGMNTIIKLSEIVRNPKLARLTESLKILDLSHASSYREITVSCYINASDKGNNIKMSLIISPLCNFYDPQALDSDGKTCTLFSSSHADSLVATPMELTQSGTVFEMEEAFFMRSDDPNGTDHYKKIDEREGDISLLITKGVDNEKIKVKDGAIRHNPVYILNKEEVKGDKEVLNPTHALRMYLYNHETSIDEHGKVTIEKKHQVKSGGKSIFYRVQPGDKRDIKISCKGFFEDSGSSGYTLLPNGKNTIFENVSDGAVDPKTIKTIQFEQDFASRGISILKKPETDVDLQLIFDEDKLIQNDHVKPIYFICAQGDWQKDKKPYAVIAIDPGYEIRKLQGCGVKSGMFLGQSESRPTGNQCMHTVDDETRVGFHCPSYVPEHFLEGDQTKHKAAEDAEVGNPYQLLLRCYDRSSVGKRMFKPMTDLELFPKPKFAGELRSLWIFDKELLAEKKHLTDILCTCYDKTGKVISHIKIKNDTNKENE